MQKKISKIHLEDKTPNSLSIQFSLGGFSFCTVNSSNLVLDLHQYWFESICTNPIDLLTKIEAIFKEEEVLHSTFESIRVIHQSNLNTLVPNTFFDEKELENYLTFNVKTFKSDFITFDSVESFLSKNVYIPFVNINNFLHQNFGDFDYYHHHSILLEKVKRQHTKDINVCANLSKNLLDVVVISDNKLQLINCFEYNSREDFIYYILFVYEQLKLDTNSVQLTLSGAIDKESNLYKIAYQYIRNVDFVNSLNPFFQKNNEFQKHEAFILIP